MKAEKGMPQEWRSPSGRGRPAPPWPQNSAEDGQIKEDPSDPGNARRHSDRAEGGATRTGTGPAVVADFPDLRNHETLGR